MSVELTPTLLAHHRVLYVDDDESYRSLFVETIGAFVPVDVACSAHEALRKLASTRYSILVTEQRMPQMSGIELCIEASARFPEVHRILATAYRSMDIVTDAVHRGSVVHFITKPWTADYLRHTLKEGLTRVELERTVDRLREDIQEKETEAAIGMEFSRIVHDLASVPMPIYTTLLDLRAIAQQDDLNAE
ncbi:MAG: response regulator, partial [Myxococcota bacterium]